MFSIHHSASATDLPKPNAVDTAQVQISDFSKVRVVRIYIMTHIKVFDRYMQIYYTNIFMRMYIKIVNIDDAIQMELIIIIMLNC